MIISRVGQITDAGTEAIVIPTMVTGKAAEGSEYRRAFPGNYRTCVQASGEGFLIPGIIYVVEMQGVPKWILNAVTRQHWKSRTRLLSVELCLVGVCVEVERRGIKSVAIPMLGVGEGLSWPEIKPVYESRLANLQGVDVQIFRWMP